MPLELTTVPRVPVLRTGHYDLESGPADFALEDLAAAAEALSNDPAVLPMRVRLELEDQGHLDGDGIAVEASGGQGGPAVGWGDNYVVEGNTLYADLHLPVVVADSMEWAFPGRSIEGVWGWTTATGHTHDFVATGLLLLGQSWPGVTTLPDFAEVQAEFAADVATGAIDTPSYATAALGAESPSDREANAARTTLERSAIVARVGATGRPPRATREQFASAGLNVADIRMRWYAAESSGDLDGLPDSYDPWSWWVTEVRVNDDGGLAAYVLDETTGQEWMFPVTSVADGQVTFGEPVEVVRPDPVPVSASAPRPRPAVARWASRAESRPASASAGNPQQEDDRPMNDALRRALAARHGLDPETATEEQIEAAELAATETPPEGDDGTPPDEGGEGTGDGTPEGQTPVPATARTTTVDRDVFERLQADAAAGAAARASQIRSERDALVRAAIADGRITPASAGLDVQADGTYPEGWRRDLDAAPEATARALARLDAGTYPGAGDRQSTTVQEGALGDGYGRAAAGLGIRRKPQEVK